MLQRDDMLSACQNAIKVQISGRDYDTALKSYSVVIKSVGSGVVTATLKFWG